MEYKKEEVLENIAIFREFLKDTIDKKFYENPYKSTLNFNNVKLESTNKVAINQQRKYDIEEIELSRENKALQRLFERIFSMWEAGRDKEKLFSTIYAFPPNDGSYANLRVKGINLLDRDENLIPINLDKEYSDYFLKCLCGRAKAVKESKSLIDAANRSRFFFIGDIGSGKTTFLNYIFSKHYAYMNKQHVMWVRVDLTKIYHSHRRLGKGNPLHEALQFQLARIFRKNYFKEEEKEVIIFLEKEFESSINTGRLNMDEAKNFIDDYIREYDRERTSPFHPIVQQAIKKYAQIKYAIIFLFDGLDQLYTGKWFEDKVSEIQEYILGNEKTKNVYIFVMRNTSHAEFLNSYLLDHEQRALSSLRKVAKSFIVLPPKLHTIVENRLDLLCDKWDEILLEVKDDVIIPETEDEEININLLQDLMNKCSWIKSETIRAYHDIFLRFIFRGLSLEQIAVPIRGWDKKQAYSALKNVVGENFRVLLEVLSSLHKIFLQTIQGLDLEGADIVS